MQRSLLPARSRPIILPDFVGAWTVPATWCSRPGRWRKARDTYFAWDGGQVAAFTRSQLCRSSTLIRLCGGSVAHLLRLYPSARRRHAFSPVEAARWLCAAIADKGEVDPEALGFELDARGRWTLASRRET